MKSRSILLIVGMVVVVAAIGYAVYASNHKTSPAYTNNAASDNSANNSSNSSSEPVPTNNVTIKGFLNSPAAITVKAGTKVTWTNSDSVAHTVTADTPSEDAPNSEPINNNQTYSFTFKKAGTYTYHCQFHPSLTGTVIVTE